MLKPLEVEYDGRPISLECTHKKKFPPPQMYGLSLEDIDKMWKQGAIDQTMHQSLTIWKDICGLFVMGPKCMACPLALLQKPRLGRPHVIETENFLSAKRRMELEKQKANRIPHPVREQPVGTSNPPRPKPQILTGNPNIGLTGLKAHREFEAIKAAFDAESVSGPEPATPEPVDQDDTPKMPLESEPTNTEEVTLAPDEAKTEIDEDMLDALADD